MLRIDQDIDENMQLWKKHGVVVPCFGFKFTPYCKVSSHC